MTEYKMENLLKIGLNVKHFEILEDVLSEIQESRTYEGEDLKALNELQEFFSYRNYKDFRDYEKARIKT